MKNIIATAFIIFTTTSFVFSQCSTTVPASSLVVKLDTVAVQMTKSGTHIWVCKKAGLILTGSRNHIYLEEDANMNIQGDSNYLYIRSSDTVTLSGEYNYAYVETGASFTDNGTFTTKTPCSKLIVAYENANIGCKPYLGFKDDINPVSTQIYPNPAGDYLYIVIPEISNGGNTIELYTMDGRMAAFHTIRYPGTTRIPISELDRGLYLVRVINGTSVLNEKLLIK